jgi:hypothetical protein
MADQEKRWNLFARELEDILATRHLGIGHLDDRAGIHREKVRRLIQSLGRPKSFPMLNAEEMEQIVKEFKLSDSEILRLRAAILAASIERTLMDRIGHDEALTAAEQIFPIIFEAMQEQINSSGGLGAVKGVDVIPSGYDESDMALDSALETIDAAVAALHLSRNVASHTERIKRAREARNSFEEALADLNEVDDDIRAIAVWQYWYDEAQKGVAAANERLEELGE